MNKKYIILALVVIAAVVGITMLGNGDQPDNAKTANTSDSVGDDTVDKVIEFTSEGYSPGTVNIKVGDTVQWVNNSDTGTWPASSLHPTHGNYPVGDGCIGSQFDSCEAIPPGESWSFKFTEKGSWGFHDHLAPMYTGAVVVE